MKLDKYSPLLIETSSLNIPFLKAHLKEFQLWQVSCFQKKANITDLVHLRSKYIDELLIRLWEKFHLNIFSDLSLIAVGGFGRSELHPKSDIDLLIMSLDTFTPEINEKISLFITFLWDLKLDIGHSVRNLGECFAQGKADITIATSLIESRRITGSSENFNKLIKSISPKYFWSSEDFFTKKRDEQIKRHKNCYGDGYSLEPDIKNGSGGLRDIQTIGWISKRHFGANSLLELTKYEYITPDEYQELHDCKIFLWNLRFAMHTVTNKADNRLLFDHQREIAELLGYFGEGSKAIEQLMKDFYQTVHRVIELNEMLLQYFNEAILGNIEKNILPIDHDFQIRDKMIELKTVNLFYKKPESILQLFLYITEFPSIKGIYSPTLRELRKARRSFTHWLQDSPKCRELFIKIIKAPRGAGLALTLLKKYGILSAYIPQWNQIAGQMQFDLFHAYTVDEHTHKLIKFIYNYPNTKEEHPLAHELFNYIEKPELLFLAAIFHDIAKGRNGDHSSLGAIDAENFCILHKISKHETNIVKFLVQNHLLMSITAQRRDISDQDEIIDFAKVVRDEKHLNFLYCLTVADISATNADSWNSWKCSLLQELYHSTLKMLRRGLENPPDIRDRIRDRKQKSLDLLLNQNFTESEVENEWKHFKLDYFLRYNSKQIVWHISNLLQFKDRSKPMILISNQSDKGGTEIFVYSKNIPFLFSSLVTEIYNKNLTVHDAKILTSKDSFSLNTFTVLDSAGMQLDLYKAQYVKVAIEKSLIKPENIRLRKRRLARVKKKFKCEPSITFLPTKKDRTQVEVVAFDSPGILANIGEVFQKNELTIHTAKISTIGERAEDLFILSDFNDNELTIDQMERLKTDLKSKLSPE